MSVEARGARERRSRRRAEQTAGAPQSPWTRLQNPLPPLELVGEEELGRIEDTAFRVLEELGLEFMSPEALDILERHGALVDRSASVVRFERALVEEYVAKAPAVFTLHARNPERNVVVGANNICFGPVSGAPNVSDLDRGRRPGTYADQVELIKLHHSLNCLHFGGGTIVEAQDLPVPTRHLDMHRAQVLYTDRCWGARGIGRDRIEDAIAIAAINRGVSREQLLREPSTYTITNTNSPRRVDKELLGGLMALAENGQAACITPFTLAGAMAPITLAGALALQHAEALAVVAFAQMVRAGTPVIYGGFTSNVDMRTGAPSFGTPEYVRATIISGQLARRRKLPYRASNVNASNSVDAQATYESAMSLWACIMAHANLVHHATGWLEGGLVASLEKVIVDAEMIDTMRAWLCSPLEVSEQSLAFDAIREVQPGGHYFGAAHTMARFETAFHRPLVSEVRNFDSWVEAGSTTATTRANAVWKRLLDNYEPPPVDPAKVEAIDAYIAKRREEIAMRGVN
ncbi:MAG: trimethylamine methyltransferase family protein [Hyphomicrobiaceae bacterium]|nr:trimethylamine methyltransferase family protein [Hyphomicrobiaceae bacterium]